MEFTPARLPFSKNKNLVFLVLNLTLETENGEIKKLQRITRRIWLHFHQIKILSYSRIQSVPPILLVKE